MRSNPVSVVERLYSEFYNQPDLAIAAQVAPSIFHDPQVFIDEYVAIRTAFPDMQFSRDSTVQQGQRVAVRWSARGTQRGELVLPRVTVPATDRWVETMGISLFEMSDGRILRRVWASSDGLEMLYQLGVRFVVPRPPAPRPRRPPHLP